MIEALLPGSVRSAETFDDDGPDELFDEERAVVAKAVAKRQREFTTVRRCARAALAELGVERVPLLPGERGAPGWPPGVVGSMTHCAGFRAAVVARNDDIAAIGVDAEPDEPLPAGVLDAIALPDDLTALAALPGSGPSWDRLLFSAKESVYKAWFPLTRRFLEFEQATVNLDPRGTFVAHLLVTGPTVDGATLDRFAGRWLATDGLVVTAVVVAR